MPSLADIVPAPILATIFAALLGSLGFSIRQRHAKRQRTNDKFRDAFLDAIIRLEKESGACRRIISVEFPKHETAAIEFRQCMSDGTLRRFNEAWKAYEAYAAEEMGGPALSMFGTEVTDMNRAKDPAHIAEVSEMRKNECLGYINALLKFAR